VKCDSIHLSGFTFPVGRERRECWVFDAVPTPRRQREDHGCRVPHRPPEKKGGIVVSCTDGVGSFPCGSTVNLTVDTFFEQGLLINAEKPVFFVHP
jgi:hypothetical protein